jgi:hypothetical protein
MLSGSPAVLITSVDPPFDTTLTNLLISAGIPVVLGTSSPHRVALGCTTVILRWEDPNTIPEVFDTGHTIQTVVLGIPDAGSREILGEIEAFTDLARAEGVDRFIIVGKEGARVEEVCAHLEEKGAPYAVLVLKYTDHRKHLFIPSIFSIS